MLCDLLKTHVILVSALRSTIDHAPLKYRSSIVTINQVRHVYLPMTVTLKSDEKEQQDIHGDWNVVNNLHVKVYHTRAKPIKFGHYQSTLLSTNLGATSLSPFKYPQSNALS